MNVVRLVVNWTVLLLSPVWIIPMFIYFVIDESRKGRGKEWTEGKSWFWESA